MQTLNIQVPGSDYPVHLGGDLLGQASLWAGTLLPGKVLVVSDDNVAPLYLEALLSALAGRDVETLVIPSGEAEKSLENWQLITDKLVEIGALRDATLVALGGGVIGDLTGFAAATYMRGVRFVQAPTTLLAQVDASVGGKTAINHVAGKNLVGAFHQPAAVIVDIETLATLPPREFSAGMAEVVKYGMIRDADFLEWLEKNSDSINARDPKTIITMISRSVQNKAVVVAEDEKEQGIRAILNYGHTFGHALETLTGYSRFLHGEAVAIGMIVAAHLSAISGSGPPYLDHRLKSLLASFGLPVTWPADISAKSAFEAMAMDKKALDSGLRLILVNDVGRAYVDNDCAERDIVRAIEDHTE
ncbi:MAG TPA: 3-dehydroquinate synthase [Xanthomonadales bacterium]|nr:3-dehydroquinate synthase [Xanthomonadales bacterium]